MQEAGEPMRANELRIKPAPQRFCHLIPGISGTKDGWRGIEKVIRKSVIDGHSYQNVQVHDSSVSVNTPNPNHFGVMAESFIQDLELAKETDGKVDIIVTSLGTNDVMRVLKIIEDQHPENLQFLRLFLISPWGLVKPGDRQHPRELMHGLVEGADSLYRFGKLLKGIMTKGDDMVFLAHQAILPVGVDPLILTKALTKAYSSRAQKIEGSPEMTTLDTSTLRDRSKNNLNLMKEADRERLEKIDGEITELLSLGLNGEKWIGRFKELNKRRAKIIGSYIWKFFDATGKDEIEPNASERTNSEKKVRGMIGNLAISLSNNLGPIFKSTFGTDYLQMIHLMEMGVPIHFIAGEFDPIVKPGQYERFIGEYKNKGAKPVAITGLTWGHIDSYSLNQEALAKAVNEVIQISLATPISQPS